MHIIFNFLMASGLRISIDFLREQESGLSPSNDKILMINPIGQQFPQLQALGGLAEQIVEAVALGFERSRPSIASSPLICCDMGHLSAPPGRCPSARPAQRIRGFILRRCDDIDCPADQAVWDAVSMVSLPPYRSP
jgi:hypothetical protein